MGKDRRPAGIWRWRRSYPSEKVLFPENTASAVPSGRDSLLGQNRAGLLPEVYGPEAPFPNGPTLSRTADGGGHFAGRRRWRPPPPAPIPRLARSAARARNANTTSTQ